MLFALPFAKRPAGFDHSTGDELDRRRGDPSSGQIGCEIIFQQPQTLTAPVLVE